MGFKKTFDTREGEMRSIRFSDLNHTPHWKRSGAADGYASVEFSTHSKNAYLSIDAEEQARDLQTGRVASKRTMISLAEPQARDLYAWLKERFEAAEEVERAARCPPPSRSPQPPHAPQIGDYIARNEPHGLGERGAYVALITGHGGWCPDEKRICHCETIEGARALAKLCNDTRDLAEQWHSLSTRAPGPSGRDLGAEEWAKGLIARAIVKVLGINAMHDFGASELGLPMFGDKGGN